MTVGKGINRADGAVKVTGAARYSADMPLEGVLHAAIVGSRIARGEVADIDASAARAAPGVVEILTPFNAPRLPEEGRAGIQPPGGRALSLLQDKRVYYNGQPVALVVAETPEEAVAASALLEVSYRSETPAVDFAAALPGSRPYTHKILGIFEPASRRGDCRAGFEQAEVTVEATYTTPVETHNPMEPHATVAVWKDERLTLYDSTQHVYGVRAFVAATLGLRPTAVRVVSHFIGGAFGCKGSAWSHVVLAAMAAQRTGRPVKLALNRRQMFGLVGARPHTMQQLSLGARSDGTLTALRHTLTASTSELEDWVEPSALIARHLYAVPNLETSHRIVRLNVGTPTFNRAPGESSGAFALESAMDELAVALRMDPIELRLKNHADQDPETGLPWSSKSLRECYRLGAEHFGWSRRNPQPRSMREGGELLGLGMATASYPARRLPASARVRVLPGGEVVVEAASHDLGTGTYTVMAQIAADVLEVPPERVRVELGDTRLPENPISAGSMTAASTGTAVHLAATAAREKLLADGANSAAAAMERLETEVQGEAQTAPGDERRRYAMNSFGAVFAEVRVDPELGVVRVSRLVGAYGAGRVLNAKTARSQLMGGIIYGMGQTLFEYTAIDARDGRYLNADLSEYLLPANADVPDIEILFADEDDSRVNPIGVKGIGEVGMTGVAGALANAVYHATGVRVRDLPITLDKLLT